MVLDSGRPPAAPRPPCVAVLSAYRIRYVGRAQAQGTGGIAVVIAKQDGSLIVHDPAGGVKPLYYNPPGNVRAWRRLDRWYFRATSKAEETLAVSGTPQPDIPSGLDFTARDRRIRRAVLGHEATPD